MEELTGKQIKARDDHLYPVTALDALEKWDKGKSVFTISMGGLGPGYEQCIHIVAFELIRAHGKDIAGLIRTNPAGKKKGTEHAADLANSRFDKTIHKIEKKFKLGLSGAQAGAAKNLAWITMERGWRETITDLKVKDRLIQVSKKFP